MSSSSLLKHTIKARPNTNDDLLIQVLDKLLYDYLIRVPDAAKVVELLLSRGDSIQNDHIAFRSIQLNSILKIFLHLGYEVRMDAISGKPFNFPSKTLTAVWLKHPNLSVPRIFVSQYRLEEGSDELQNTVRKYLEHWQDSIDSVDLNNADSIYKYLHTAQWQTPTFDDYCKIQNESEYLSWVLYNKYYLNHFTVTVHALNSFDFVHEVISTLKSYQIIYKESPSNDVISDAILKMKCLYKKQFSQFNKWLLDNDFKLNPVNNHFINISPDECLLQSSTKSQTIKAAFEDGTEYTIPGSYVEFAYRGLVPESIEELIKCKSPLDVDTINKPSYYRDGFEVQNADKIFESTYIAPSIITSTNENNFYEESCKRIFNFLDGYCHDVSKLQQ
jgi:hypothetical protein